MFGNEDQLTEDQLILRIDKAWEWCKEADKLRYKNELDKATPGQRGGWEVTRDYFDQIIDLFKDVLAVKIADRFGTLSIEEREKEIRRLEEECNRKVGQGKLWFWNSLISKSDALKDIETIRAAMGAKIDSDREALRDFGIKDSEFWPARVSTEKKQSKTPISDLNPFHSLIASILIRHRLHISNKNVATHIPANHPSLPPQYRDPNPPSNKATLSDFLNNNSKLKKRFEHTVSAVRNNL